MNDGIVLYVKASVLQYRIVRNEDAVFEFGGCRFIGSVGNACIDDDIVEDPVASQTVIFNATSFPVSNVIVVAITTGSSSQHDSRHLVGVLGLTVK